MKIALKNAPQIVHKQPSYQLGSDHLSTTNATFHGKHDDGRYRVKINGQKALSTAALYELYPKASSDGFLRRLISTTPGYKSGLPDELSLVAIGTKTQSQFLVIGTLEYLESRAEKPISPKIEEAHAQLPKVDSSLILTNIESVFSVESTPSEVEDKKCAREQRRLKAFIRELAIIKAQCEAGFDPPISIPATGFLSKRSIATTYRDIQKGILPKPIKIGRNSTFPYSVAKAYADGQLVAVGI